ncbi:MAG: hypothetical protein GXO57_04935 [Thermodesulfobacteria bacterium]|nr:hypothetical protein [Thermodesulfobacteriota bacterium]
MEELKKFDKKKIQKSSSEVKEVLNEVGLNASHIPENFEEFDELELKFDLDEKFDFCFCITIFNNEIQRMMLIKVEKNNPDSIQPPNEEDLKTFKSKYIPKLVQFLEQIT